MPHRPETAGISCNIRVLTPGVWRIGTLHILEQLLLVLGLSMDGFAASVCMGMAAGPRRIGPIVAIMSGFHVGMLLLGYAVGAGLPDSLTAM